MKKIIFIFIVAFFSCLSSDVKPSKAEYKEKLKAISIEIARELNMEYEVSYDYKDDFTLLYMQNRFCRLNISDSVVDSIGYVSYSFYHKKAKKNIKNRTIQIEMYYSNDVEKIKNIYNKIIVNPICIEEDFFRVTGKNIKGNVIYLFNTNGVDPKRIEEYFE